MTISAESNVADVLSAVNELITSPAFQAMLPVVLGALQSGSGLSNPVAAAAFGAQFITDLAAVLPKIDGPALQAAVTLVEGLLTAIAPKAPAEPVPTPAAPQTQVPTIEGTVTQ